MAQSKRVLWPDVMKGIGILMVVVFHAIIPGVRTTFFPKLLFNLLQEIHMPLFFFVSGWVFALNEDKCRQKKAAALRSRLQRLMLPYFVFSALYYAAIQLALRIDFVQSMLTMSDGGYARCTFPQAVRQILTFDGAMAESLWFLYALFIISAVSILLPRATKHIAFLIVILPLCLIPRLFPDFFQPVKILLLVFYYFFYFSLARVLFAHTEKIVQMRPGTFAFVAACFVVFSFIGVCIFEMNILSLPNGTFLHKAYPFIRQAAAVFAILTLCPFAARIGESRVGHVLTGLGQKSMIIYLIHAPILTPAVVVLCMHFLPRIPVVLCVAAGIAVGLAVPLLFDRLVLRRAPLLRTLLTGAKYNRKKAD